MSIFHRIYVFIEGLNDSQTVCLPHHIRDELFCASLLLPVCSASISWPISVQLSASDASLTGGGRASTLTTRSFAKSLYRFSEKKGEYCRLDWEKNSIPPPSMMQQTPTVLVDALMKHRWKATQTKRFRKREHINLLEMEMLKEEIKARTNKNRGHCRFVNLCDSRVVVGAYAKGRSSSRQLNHKLRACLAWSLGGGSVSD